MTPKPPLWSQTPQPLSLNEDQIHMLWDRLARYKTEAPMDNAAAGDLDFAPAKQSYGSDDPWSLVILYYLLSLLSQLSLVSLLSLRAPVIPIPCFFFYLGPVIHVVTAAAAIVIEQGENPVSEGQPGKLQH